MSQIFFVSILAETSRHPFDLPEAEAELVSGYNVEYSAMGFALFFLGEYSNMISMCVLYSILFLGGSLLFGGYSSLFILSFKTVFLMMMFIWSRAAYPRYRYDNLMQLGWKCLLPITMSFMFFNSTLYMIS